MAKLDKDWGKTYFSHFLAYAVFYKSVYRLWNFMFCYNSYESFRRRVIFCEMNFSMNYNYCTIRQRIRLLRLYYGPIYIITFQKKMRNVLLKTCVMALWKINFSNFYSSNLKSNFFSQSNIISAFIRNLDHTFQINIFLRYKISKNHFEIS